MIHGRGAGTQRLADDGAGVVKRGVGLLLHNIDDRHCTLPTIPMVGNVGALGCICLSNKLGLSWQVSGGEWRALGIHDDILPLCLVVGAIFDGEVFKSSFGELHSH